MTHSGEVEPSLDADARRTALEIMASLMNVKRLAADHILRPAGVPQVLINRFINGRDPTTGEFSQGARANNAAPHARCW